MTVRFLFFLLHTYSVNLYCSQVSTFTSSVTPLPHNMHFLSLFCSLSFLLHPPHLSSQLFFLSLSLSIFFSLSLFLSLYVPLFLSPPSSHPPLILLYNQRNWRTRRLHHYAFNHPVVSLYHWGQS